MFFLILYVVVLLGFGLFEFKKIKNFDDFIISGRSQGTGAIAFSILATCIGASATLGVVSTARDIGFPAFWWLGAGAVGLWLQSLFLSQKVRQVGAYTLPDLTEKLMGRDARFLTSIIVVIAWTGIIAAQFVAGAKLMSAFGNIDPKVCILVTALVIIAYSAMGGQSSVMKTDKVQFVLLGGTLLFTLVYLYAGQPVPLEGIRFDLTNEGFTFENLVYYLLVVGGSYFVCPLLFSRILTARDARTAGKASFLSALGLVVVSLVITLIGIWASFHIDPSQGKDVLGYIIAEKLPPAMGVALLIGLVSAIISSADTCLFAVASIVEYDILKQERVRSTRLVVIIVGLVAALLAMKNPDIISLLIQAYAVFTAGVVPPVAVALIMWKKRIIHPYYRRLAFIMGGICGVASNLMGMDMLAVGGMGVSTALSIAGLYVPQSELVISPEKK
ncbi:MAG: sodium:solute symporter family protein [Desulfobacterales bacterium]|nr:sodium:solute symporter family protein [Desulfobacterales bacterium]